ncbi:hypothetical protein AB4Y97_06665 [Microvirga sp. 2TAF3]
MFTKFAASLRKQPLIVKSRVLLPFPPDFRLTEEGLELYSRSVSTAMTSVAFAAGQNDAPVKGGTLIYLEQAHEALSAGWQFYPNGGGLNQITDKLIYQNSQTLKIEPWIAES